MERGYLADTNAVIDFCNGKLPENGKALLLSAPPQVSVITHIELFAAQNIAASELELLQKFVALSTIHPVAESLLETVIRIRREYRLKVPDAIIAATALQQNLVLITRNTSDFQRVSGLQLVNPHLI